MAAALYMDAVIAPNRSMGGLGFKVVLGALAGMAAAVLPSRRAARLDVLRAVASE
jgi:hypothetical protein